MRGRRAGWGPGLAGCSRSDHGAHNGGSSDAPSRSGGQALGSLGSGGGFLARSADALIKPRVHFPAQLSPARCASQE